MKAASINGTKNISFYLKSEDDSEITLKPASYKTNYFCHIMAISTLNNVY